MISHRHRLIVIHTPRCGGTSVEEGLNDSTGHHSPASWYRANYQDAWNNYRKIGLWRDPMDRFISLWRYWTSLEDQRWGVHEDVLSRTRAAWRYKAIAGSSVNGLIEALPTLQRAADWSDCHFRPQAYFLDVPGIEVLPIGVAHTEIEAHTGLKLPHCNKSLGEPWCWGRDFEEDVNSFYAEDYELCE